MRIYTITTLFFFVISFKVVAQAVPASDENIPYLVTFGKNAEASWGDDDHCQIFFFKVPKTYTEPLFIRVYDPDVGGEVDEVNEVFDSKTKISVFGGDQAFSHEDAREIDPKGNFDSGNLLNSKVFGESATYDQKWYTFGPFNPTEGEYIEAFDEYVFKIIIQGVTGNDGNLYRLFLSTSDSENKPIEGANAFTFEYTFRMPDDVNQVCHIYPFVDNSVISVEQHNFDYDGDGIIRIVSVAKKGVFVKSSVEAEWKSSSHNIVEKEKNTSLDIQMIKAKGKNITNNNVSFYVTNQRNEVLPFYAIPIGGVPQFSATIGIKKK